MQLLFEPPFIQLSHLLPLNNTALHHSTELVYSTLLLAVSEESAHDHAALGIQHSPGYPKFSTPLQRLNATGLTLNSKSRTQRTQQSLILSRVT